MEISVTIAGETLTFPTVEDAKNTLFEALFAIVNKDGSDPKHDGGNCFWNFSYSYYHYPAFYTPLEQKFKAIVSELQKHAELNVTLDTIRNLENKLGWPLLFLAVQNKHYEIFQFLCSNEPLGLLRTGQPQPLNLFLRLAHYPFKNELIVFCQYLFIHIDKYSDKQKESFRELSNSALDQGKAFHISDNHKLHLLFLSIYILCLAGKKEKAKELFDNYKKYGVNYDSLYLFCLNHISPFNKIISPLRSHLIQFSNLAEVLGFGGSLWNRSLTISNIDWATVALCCIEVNNFKAAYNMFTHIHTANFRVKLHKSIQVSLESCAKWPENFAPIFPRNLKILNFMFVHKDNPINVDTLKEIYNENHDVCYDLLKNHLAYYGKFLYMNWLTQKDKENLR
ncbi:MAG: hypothetical protein JSS53_02645 [Proteobacteria bacterium]|nr:hypothetical protein [Pseudomonadota bacterium]